MSKFCEQRENQEERNNSDRNNLQKKLVNNDWCEDFIACEAFWSKRCNGKKGQECPDIQSRK